MLDISGTINHKKLLNVPLYSDISFIKGRIKEFVQGGFNFSSFHGAQHSSRWHLETIYFTNPEGAEPL